MTMIRVGIKRIRWCVQRGRVQHKVQVHYIQYCFACNAIAIRITSIGQKYKHAKKGGSSAMDL